MRAIYTCSFKSPAQTIQSFTCIFYAKLLMLTLDYRHYSSVCRMYNWKCQTGITAQPLWFTESVYLSKMTSFGPAAQTQISPPAGKHTIKLADICHLFSLHLEQIHACTLCIKCYITAAAIAVHYQHALKQQQVYLPFSALAPKLTRLVASINLVTPRIALFVEHLRCPCVVT